MVRLNRILYLVMVLILAGCQSQPKEKAPVLPEVAKSSVEAIPTPISSPVIGCTKLVIKKKCPKPSPKAEKKYDLLVIGQIEKVLIMPGGLILNARIDTGATTSSIGVKDLESYERDGKPWVKFNIVDPKTKKKYAFNVKRKRMVRIKQHESGDYERRPVVKLRVILDKINHVREFTLADRTSFANPVLIGRNFLIDTAIVDVSQKFITQPRSTNK
jgi:hypothetical protein